MPSASIVLEQAQVIAVGRGSQGLGVSAGGSFGGLTTSAQPVWITVDLTMEDGARVVAASRLAQDLSRDLALEGSGRRLADPVWDDCAAALLLSHQTGGALGETLEHLAASVRAEVDLRKAITAQHAATLRAAHITTTRKQRARVWLGTSCARRVCQPRVPR